MIYNESEELIMSNRCEYCDNKPGFLSTGYICKLTGKELDKNSDLYKYGCWGSCGWKYCPNYKKNGT